jgi:hypothetical protein
LSKTLDELSVVIPVYDEAANILLGEIEACLDGRVHYEVIVVDEERVLVFSSRCGMLYHCQ